MTTSIHRHEGRGDVELEAEVRFHLDELIQEKISSGTPSNEARWAAQRMLGGIEQYKEECRDMRRVNFLEDLVRDVRYATRSLAKTPGFTAVVVGYVVWRDLNALRYLTT